MNAMIAAARKWMPTCTTLEDLAYAISKETEYTEDEIMDLYVDEILENV